MMKHFQAIILAAAFSAVLAGNETTTRTTTTTVVTTWTVTAATMTKLTTTTTTMTYRNMTGVVRKVAGKMTVAVSDPSAILNNADAKKAFESAMATQVAAAAGNGISASNVNVTVSAGSSRRLQAGGGLTVSYEITVPSTVSDASQVVTTISGRSADYLKTAVTMAVSTAAQTVTSLSSLTVSSVAQTAPTVTETNTTPSPSPSPAPTPSPTPSSSGNVDGVKPAAMMHAMSSVCAALGMIVTVMN
eukprot:TRINITY_DN752_c0_g1_i1.p1 TRINITY_DN752_c0_g1~~TRINITY_DN752_c0_g1_i1.p1  ORF type:complete len:246 (-),score=36.80 TRINITY_DN752_c0_g1_i1:213-950(-)